MIQMGNKIM